MSVRDVNEAQFTQVVVEGSRIRPVVVDFWAAWCGPCRQLSPLLEQMGDKYAGEVDVVKVDVDANPRLAQTFRVQGIPAVKAFSGGQMVNEFTGLQPAPVIDAFFAALAPSEADKLVALAMTEADEAARIELYRKAVASQPDHPGAALGLYPLMDTVEESRDVLAKARPTPEVQQALAALKLRLSGPVDNLDTLRERVAAGEDDARVDLGKALAAGGHHEEAIEVLLAAVATPHTRDAAREALLDVFTSLGNDSALVRAARPKLASALF